MDIGTIMIGFGIGFVLAFLFFSLLNKTKNVSRVDYESLSQKQNETGTLLRVAEERNASLNQDNARIRLKLETKEGEVALLQSKSATLENTLLNYESKFKELSEALTNYTQRIVLLQRQEQEIMQKLTLETANNTSLKDGLKDAKEALANFGQVNETLTQKINGLIAENSTLIANNRTLNERLTSHKEEIVEIQKTAHLQFEKIANQILEEKSGKFTEANKANIEALLKPLGENIDNFKKKVEETYDKESKQRFTLEEKVKELIEQANKVSSEANNLASALKGQAKKQGNWGEMILESILQTSGLAKDREYFLQQTIKDDEGKSLRPDVLVKLPDDRIIIIDSKVSLVAYDRFSSADTSEEQALHLTEHLRSIHGHIDDLYSKKYDNLEASLDFTMMFLPIEPAYLIAIQADQELWSYAYSKRILLISPTNLIACLKLISDLWKREIQSKNAMEIVSRGEKLYEKFVSFASSLEEVGKHIEKTQHTYSTAMSQLNSGSGNLVGQALKLKNLGLKSSKVIPTALLLLNEEREEDGL